MPSPTSKDTRRRDLAQIHLAIKQLGLTADDHRSLLQQLHGVTTSADLNVRQRGQYIAHLRKLGFKPAPPKGAGTRKLADDQQSKMMRGLWLELAGMGVVRNSAESALAAYVRRQTGVGALQWLSSKQASDVIESLKSWKDRAVSEERHASPV